ncbi:MAG: GxxExxY protein [Desulfatirhabdiaceae bacterium]
MQHNDLTHKIISCAYKVHNTLGFGFLESVYKKGMVIEFSQKSLKVEDEKPLKVYYAGQVVGEFYVDLFIEDEIVVELKAVEKLGKIHEVQLVNYLTALKKDIGLRINFGPTGVEVKRKYRYIGQDKQDQQDVECLEKQ